MRDCRLAYPGYVSCYIRYIGPELGKKIHVYTYSTFKASGGGMQFHWGRRSPEVCLRRRVCTYGYTHIYVPTTTYTNRRQHSTSGGTPLDLMPWPAGHRSTFASPTNAVVFGGRGGLYRSEGVDTTKERASSWCLGIIIHVITLHRSASLRRIYTGTELEGRLASSQQFIYVSSPW